MVHPWTGQTEEVAGGSGFVIREDGVIMSNAHVVHPPGMPVKRVSYTVHFDDGRCYQANLIGADRLSDIAVLQAVPANPGDRWSALKFAAAGSAAPGDAVAALGCPFGGRLAISTGVVSSQYYVADDSGLASVMPAGMLSTALMQFDSPIVSGNSGGPIVNACGEVVGIAAMSKNSVRESVYLGITAEHANAIAGQLLDHGKVQRPLLGVRVMNFDRVRWAHVAAQMQLNSALGVAPAGPPANVHHGLLVMEVAPASPAFTAGLQPRDIIIGVNGHPAGTKGDLYAAVGPVYVKGHKLTVDVVRGEHRLQLTIVPTCRA